MASQVTAGTPARSARLLALALAWVVVGAPAQAQQREGALARPPLELRLPAPTTDWRAAPEVAVLASALVPGAGQYLQGQGRWVPYLALELWSWIRFAQRRHDAGVHAERYRDLAMVARRVSGATRRDTVFEYYEAMSYSHASGAFDASPTQPGIQPERDTDTFNGVIWQLASGLFIGDETLYPPGTPQYEGALRYYESRAIPPSFAWAWGFSNLEQQVFRDAIEASDDAYRDSTRMLGLILANHIFSAVDALVTARLRAMAGPTAEFETRLQPDPHGPRFNASVRIPW